MKGSYEVVVQNARVQFKFVISRNLTILRGDSATGKTTLIDMISEYDEMGKGSGVELRCPCRVLSGRTWKAVLQTIQDSIVFIDEGMFPRRSCEMVFATYQLNIPPDCNKGFYEGMSWEDVYRVLDDLFVEEQLTPKDKNLPLHYVHPTFGRR